MSDPFAILGLEPRFDLDLAAVEVRHRELSRTLHPDRHAGKPAAERRQALSLAIEVNDALRVLKDPVRRAEALLERSGVRVSEDGKEPPAAPEFLMDVLELREELSAAQRAADLSRVKSLASQVEARQGSTERDLNQAFTALTAERALAPAVAERIGQKLAELRYFRRFLAEARAIEDEIA